MLNMLPCSVCHSNSQTVTAVTLFTFRFMIQEYSKLQILLKCRICVLIFQIFFVVTMLRNCRLRTLQNHFCHFVSYCRFFFFSSVRFYFCQFVCMITIYFSVCFLSVRRYPDLSKTNITNKQILFISSLPDCEDLQELTGQIVDIGELMQVSLLKANR